MAISGKKRDLWILWLMLMEDIKLSDVDYFCLSEANESSDET